jgi:hypothetical protein
LILILSWVATFKFLLEWSHKSPLSLHISLIYPNVLTTCSVIFSDIFNNITRLKQAVMAEPIEWLDRCSQYSDWATGWTTEESWFNSLLGQETFFSSKSSRPVMGPTQHPFQWELGISFPKSKMARMWSWPFTFIYSLGYRCV